MCDTVSEAPQHRTSTSPRQSYLHKESEAAAHGARPEEGPCPASGLETTWGKQISEGVVGEHKMEKQKALRSAQTLPRARRVSPPHWFSLLTDTPRGIFCFADVVCPWPQADKMTFL